MKKLLLLFVALSLLTHCAWAKNVTVIYNFPEGTFPDIENGISAGEDANAFSAFMAVAEQQGLDMNMTYYASFDSWFVNGINGINNSAEQYWHFWVNGEASMVGISSYVPAEGDTIELGFEDEPTRTREIVVQEALGWLAANQRPDGEIGEHKTWGNAFALMALNLFPENNTVKEKAADYLLANQQEDAGFSYPGFDSDALHTSAAIMGLVANGLKTEDFPKGGKTAMGFLLTKQENDGGFSGWGSSDVDTTAWAAMAFYAANQAMPTKNGKTPTDYLLSAQNSDGGFGYQTGQASAQDYTAEALIALSRAGRERGTAIDSAIGWIRSKQDASGCLSNAYTTALGAMALTAFEEDASPATQCLKGMQLADNGFGRDGTNSNAVDTAIAAIALGGKVLPTGKQPPTGNEDGVALGSVAKFTVTITNTGKVPATNVLISLNGIPESWIRKETSTLEIAEINPNETVQADIYVNLEEEGSYEVSATVSATGVVGKAVSNTVGFEVLATELSVGLSMQ